MILSILSDFCLIRFLIFYPQTSLTILKNDYSYKIACSQLPLYVFMCEKKNKQGRKNKKTEKVNNSQKNLSYEKTSLSMILRKLLFLVEFEPSDSYKKNSYKKTQCSSYEIIRMR